MTDYIARFWARVDKREPNQCWPWKLALDRKGYGRAYVDSVGHRAHRLAYMLTFGAIPAGLHVLHHCDNPSCCNPDHLFLGTNADNMADRDAKGRVARGADHYNRQKTHCPKGHPYDEANTYLIPTGGRACRECSRISARERWRRNHPDAPRRLADS